MKLTTEQRRKLHDDTAYFSDDAWEAHEQSGRFHSAVIDLLADLEEAEAKLAAVTKQLSEAEAILTTVIDAALCGPVGKDLRAAIDLAMSGDHKSALAAAIEQAVAPYRQDAEAMRLLSSGEWSLVKQPPARDEGGVRSWNAQVLSTAFQAAIADIAAKGGRL